MLLKVKLFIIFNLNYTLYYKKSSIFNYFVIIFYYLINFWMK